MRSPRKIITMFPPEEPKVITPKLCECGPEPLTTLTVSSDYEDISTQVPEYISIIGKKFKVTLINKEDNTSLGIEEDGECDYTTQEIKIRKVGGPDYIKDTIMHECLHGVENAFGLDLSEKQVTRLATGLIALFNDNPELRLFLLNE